MNCFMIDDSSLAISFSLYFWNSKWSPHHTHFFLSKTKANLLELFLDNKQKKNKNLWKFICQLSILSSSNSCFLTLCRWRITKGKNIYICLIIDPKDWLMKNSYSILNNNITSSTFPTLYNLIIKAVATHKFPNWFHMHTVVNYGYPCFELTHKRSKLMKVLNHGYPYHRVWYLILQRITVKYVVSITVTATSKTMISHPRLRLRILIKTSWSPDS